MSHKMDVQIKSITPKSGTEYRFRVELSVDGKTETVPREIKAQEVLDFHQFRVAVARHTGYLLAGQAGAWDVLLPQVWQAPEQQPEASDDIVSDDAGPSQEDVNAMPKELRDICEM
jgi:hypothetical protein